MKHYANDENEAPDAIATLSPQITHAAHNVHQPLAAGLVS